MSTSFLFRKEKLSELIFKTFGLGFPDENQISSDNDFLYIQSRFGGRTGDLFRGIGFGLGQTLILRGGGNCGGFGEVISGDRAERLDDL